MFLINIELSGPEASTPKQRAAVLRKTFRKIGQRHHDKYKHLKFTASAYRRYGLKSRNKKYEREKHDRRKRKGMPRPTGEVLPFVYTGRSRTSTMASRRVVVSKVTESGTCDATVILPARVLNRIPWLRAEYERVNQQELRAQARFGLKEYENGLKRIRTRKRKKV